MIGAVSNVGYTPYITPYKPISSVQGSVESSINRAAYATETQAAQVRAASGTSDTPQIRMAVIPEAQTGTPVQPVNPVRQVMEAPVDKTELMRKLLSDTTAMAVRSRIEYLDGNKSAIERRAALDDKLQDASESKTVLKDRAQDVSESKTAQEIAKEAECQTCENRKYQDGSDDPGVSFKTATHIAPEQSASKVRGHELEHVGRERAEAMREGREVVSQSVTYQTNICPECGDVYVSGGTTRTVTAAQQSPAMKQAQENAGYNGGFLAVA